MKEYATPLNKRRADAERYWNSAEIRLRKVNNTRRRRGQPLLASAEEIGRDAKPFERRA